MPPADRILKGDRLALARLITAVENDSDEGRKSLDELFPFTGKGHIIGITGPSGAGKSTLVNSLVKAILANDPHVALGIIAVDPTSPFTGGALLGDRVRMRDISADERVFVRSMATRGALGGLTQTVPAVIQLMDAAGLDPILVETVGAGQAEVEIARVAHTTIVMEAPGLGDDVQAIKAGILEIADILVVNKADRPGADGVIQALQAMLELGFPHQNVDDTNPQDYWIPPIFATVATEEKGIRELVDGIHRHRDWILRNGDWQRKDSLRVQAWLEALYAGKMRSQWQAVKQSGIYPQLVASMLERRISPFQALKVIEEADKGISA
jgi:LAO/AO transport system kinase